MELDNVTQLRNAIQSLDNSKHIEIFKIFKQHDVFYSENKNGIFINLSEVSDEVIVEVRKYIDYICNQERQIEIVEQQKVDLQNTMIN